jgi:hypothetical protein
MWQAYRTLQTFAQSIYKKQDKSPWYCPANGDALLRVSSRKDAFIGIVLKSEPVSEWRLWVLYPSRNHTDLYRAVSCEDICDHNLLCR